MEVWHNRTPVWQKRTLRNGRPSTVTVRYLVIGSDSEGSASWAEVRGEVDVVVPGGPATPLRGLFNGHKKMAPYVTPGTQLPVVLHERDDQKLVIDWKRWDRDGGLAAAKAQGGADAAEAANTAVYETARAAEPAAPPTTAASTAGAGGGWQEQSIAAWRAAVASGHMSQDEFDRAMEELRQAGGA